ncbi:hypothetical protein C8P68_11262 [Mucilaginibacter yixingensis]|uniref:LTXXQ motif family protein n=1 Tax=Mucilaginibacter yixingensis TaxID=1295612 RepID=A0A2T5J4N2_9SPHI|nr:hypothetical protein [Mucilaginibacter yixingensis]PTQ92462.1 hypothetical protein C8P68_11262 [Mucilaginibacter yixingensis]
MKKILALLILGIIFTNSSYSQQRDTTKHKESDNHRMNRFIRQRLGIDSIKAEQVDAIQATYKAGIARVASSGLSEDQRRRAIDSLMRQKNARLAAILTLEQQAKIIPSTERSKEKSTVTKKQ